MKAVIARYRDLRDPQRAERTVELVVLALAAILLLQVVWGVFRLVIPGLPAPLPPAEDALRVARFAGVGPVSEELRGEIRSRPLFWASRRPVDIEEVVVPEAPVEAGLAKPGKIRDVTLTGVFGSGDSAGIIVSAKGREQRLLIGDELKGWRLESVSPDKAVFSGGGGTAELDLKQAAIKVSPRAADSGVAAEAGNVRRSGEGKNRRYNGAKTPADDAAETRSNTLSLGGGARGK